MTNNPPELLTGALIRQHYLPIGKRTFDRWLSCGRFPGPDMKLSHRAHFWRRATVENWIEANQEKTAPAGGAGAA
jgi:predicted DNA-binding transcriptional regulator AlpA